MNRGILISTIAFIIISTVSYAQTMPVPAGKEIRTYSAVAAPIMSSIFSEAQPIGVGSLVTGGNTLSVQIGLVQTSGPVDIYGAYSVSIDPDHVYILKPDGTTFIQVTVSDINNALATGIPPQGAQPWKANSTGQISQTLITVPVSKLPQGIYTAYLLVARPGGITSFYLWATNFSTEHIVFITSVTGNGNIGSWPDAGGATGLQAGDTICNARADAAGLNGTFVAWLSNDTHDAYCRVHGLTGKKSAKCGQAALPVSAGPWVRTDGFPFSEKIGQMLYPIHVIFVPARYDEYGERLVTTSTLNIRTGTYSDGTATPGRSCNGWTDSSATNVLGGNSNAIGEGFTSNWGGGCSAGTHLLCFQRGAGGPITVPVSTGKKVFVTSVAGSGNLGSWPGAGGNTGVAAADAICGNRAFSAGLSGNYRAWISDSTTNAKDRITGDGPWVKLDGVRIADSRADLLDGTLSTAINLTETGSYLGSERSWTSTNESGNKTAQTCSDWTDGTSASASEQGIVDNAVDQWSNWNSFTCDGAFRLYCFEY